MKKRSAAVAAAVAVLALGLLSGVALAGDHHGDNGSKHVQKSESAQQNGSSTDSQAGQKPSNTTQKDTSCTSGGGSGSSATCSSDNSSKSDASKRYGNGKTAAQIANGKGAPSGTQITGPGNSQPHKICGRDVHAYGKGHSSKCGEKTPPPAKPEQVTFCDMDSATSGHLATKNAAELANHMDSGDIVPPFTYNGTKYSQNWDTNGEAIFNAGCNVSPPPTTTTVESCTDEDSGQASQEEQHESAEAKQHESENEAKHDSDVSASDNDQDECGNVSNTTTTVETTTTVPTTNTTTTEATTTGTVAATTTVETTTVETTTTNATGAASINTGTPSSASGVKGASKTIVAPASASHPSHGVLGVAKTLGSSATSGTLPFTGLRLWIVELIALGLIGSGVAMRLIARRRPN